MHHTSSFNCSKANGIIAPHRRSKSSKIHGKAVHNQKSVLDEILSLYFSRKRMEKVQGNTKYFEISWNELEAMHDDTRKEKEEALKDST
mmetsp:Transcript_6521/g.8603  ORF Transcript_6521/g.8603 Transcript_6521/m.8603 type:complete len:89 (+) Transcript_6521:68-334(+)